MRSKVADAVRQEQIEEIRRMTPAERVALAIQLGERDLAVYMAFQRVDRARALRDVRRSRQSGRRTSRCIQALLE